MHWFSSLRDLLLHHLFIQFSKEDAYKASLFRIEDYLNLFWFCTGIYRSRDYCQISYIWYIFQKTIANLQVSDLIIFGSRQDWLSPKAERLSGGYTKGRLAPFQVYALKKSNDILEFSNVDFSETITRRPRILHVWINNFTHQNLLELFFDYVFVTEHFHFKSSN